MALEIAQPRRELLGRQFRLHVQSDLGADAVGGIGVQPNLRRQDSEAFSVVRPRGANL